ncbi:TIGR00282 family metallophosphoesterase [Culicoidibacter larvae]|uniref:TIGR00282 family metallophosphoesterase n=1 Tax=Culicoidibacter larvae TaxID=2579976 RepID=A0A5R8Q8J5_9FIRM|nr:TIGR00282 family metallophosphoesterase [Culicoidibacter larvae]TLG72028.1 TIGR00282 family metallophosphoesterase [Culicoidibacter larvae]
MKILFVGDIYASSGRDILSDKLPELRAAYQPDFIIVNAENAAHGKGINQKIYESILDMGADVMTMGNHTWDNRSIFSFIDEANNLVRPANGPAAWPGVGYRLMKAGKSRIAVINLLGMVDVNGAASSPFTCFDAIYEQIKDEVDYIFVDLHAEATSEKIAFGWYVDGRASAVVGTHTHVPTADARILPKGCAYQTDVGMTGPRDGVIGVDRDIIIHRFVTGLPQGFSVAEGVTQLNAVAITFDDESKKAIEIVPIHIEQ